MGTVSDEIKKPALQTTTNFKFRTRKNVLILRQDRFRHVEPRRLRDSKDKNRSLQTVRSKGGGNDDVRVDDQPERQHQNSFFFFCDRVARMIESIRRGVMACVPFRFDSSPSNRSTSGSGAASFT